MKVFEPASVLKRTKNRFSLFKASEAAEDMSAGSRLRTQGFALISHSPKFKIVSTSKFFTLGSCFAREIEESLIARGISVLGSEFSLPKKYRIGGRWGREEYFSTRGFTLENQRSCLNKYSVHSMAQCLELATNFDDDKLESLLIATPSGYVNPHQHLSVALPLEESIDLFRDMMSVYKLVTEAEVIVLTLGQTELWYDNETRTILNGTPPMEALKLFPQRFVFCMPDFFEIYAELARISGLIESHCRNSPKVILTVSPVPFSRTFSGEDAIVANAMSKASLLVAARTMCIDKQNWDYFPSYEMVTSSCREWAIEPDGVHVMPRCVERVVEEFCRLYLE